MAFKKDQGKKSKIWQYNYKAIIRHLPHPDETSCKGKTSSFWTLISFPKAQKKSSNQKVKGIGKKLMLSTIKHLPPSAPGALNESFTKSLATSFVTDTPLKTTVTTVQEKGPPILPTEPLPVLKRSRGSVS